jgi:hypothetical protein
VIDTIGFADNRFDYTRILPDFREKLKEVNNQVDCVIFVLQMGRINESLKKYLGLFQKDILLGKFKNNSFLLITQAYDNWVEENKDSAELKEILELCNNKYYCLDLRPDGKKYPDMSQEQLQQYNKDAIDKFLQYLDGKQFNKVDISQVQTDEYAKTWQKFILPALGFGVVGVFAAFARCNIQ